MHNAQTQFRHAARHDSLSSVRETDLLVFDMGAFLDPPALGAAWLLGSFLLGRDPVEGEQAEVAQQRLVVDASERSVVDDALRTGDQG
jgi:hypothetical protein